MSQIIQRDFQKTRKETITLEPGKFLLINSGLVHASRCPSGNRTILMQVPDKFLSACLSDVSRLWFVIDYDSPDPEVQEDIQRLRNLLLDMIHLQETSRPGYLFGFTNAKLFHRLFRDRFHTTPRQARKTAGISGQRAETKEQCAR